VQKLVKGAFIIIVAVILMLASVNPC